MVAHEAKLSPLGEHRRLFLERAVAEAKREATRHALAVRELNQVAVGDDSAPGPPENQKSPNDPLRVTDGHGIGAQCNGTEEAGDEEQ